MFVCIYFVQWCLLNTQEHIEGYLELSAKTKTYFATAVSLWDADFYIKVDDDIHVNIGKIETELIKINWFTFI